MKLSAFVLLAFAVFAAAHHHSEKVPSLEKACVCDPVICPTQLMNKKSVSLNCVLVIEERC
jgi:hypothetical protein